MAVKKSVRLVDNTIALCKVFSGNGPINWSGSINGAANMLGFLVEQGKIELLRDEVELLCVISGISEKNSLPLDRNDFEKLFDGVQFITELKVKGEPGEPDSFYGDDDIEKLRNKLLGATDVGLLCTGMYLALSAGEFDFDMGQK